MTVLRRNIFANYVSQAWSGLMALAFIPIYIEMLGMEAYGLIGLFSVLQALSMLLDLGIGATLNREMARYTAGAHSLQSARDLLHSLEAICCVLAVLTGAAIWLSSNYLATDWLKAERLSHEAVRQAVSIMGLIIALRLFEGIYRGALCGLEHQVWYNVAYSLLATLRYGGAIAILKWVSTSLAAFFVWQATTALLTLIVLAVGVHRKLPKAPEQSRFSRVALIAIWRYAGGTMAITVLTMLFLQIDKVLLSRILPLAELGRYALAATAASVLFMVVVPLTQATFPRMVKLSASDDRTHLADMYHNTTQLATILTAAAAMPLIFFPAGVLFMWSGNVEFVLSTAPLVSLLALGCLMNCIAYLPYNLQLSQGRTGLFININLVLVITLTSAIFLIVPKYGVIASAWIWLSVNAGYLMVASRLTHRALIPKEQWTWAMDDVLLPTIGTICACLVMQAVQPGDYQDRLHWLFFLLLAAVLSAFLATIFASRTRNVFLQHLRRKRQ